MRIINPGAASSAFPAITSQQVKLSFHIVGCDMFSVDGKHRAENSICLWKCTPVSAGLSASSFKEMPCLLEREYAIKLELQCCYS